MPGAQVLIIPFGPVFMDSNLSCEERYSQEPTFEPAAVWDLSWQDGRQLHSSTNLCNFGHLWSKVRNPIP